MIVPLLSLLLIPLALLVTLITVLADAPDNAASRWHAIPASGV